MSRKLRRGEWKEEFSEPEERSSLKRPDQSEREEGLTAAEARARRKVNAEFDKLFQKIQTGYQPSSRELSMEGYQHHLQEDPGLFYDIATRLSGVREMMIRRKELLSAMGELREFTTKVLDANRPPASSQSYPYCCGEELTLDEEMALLGRGTGEGRSEEEEPEEEKPKYHHELLRLVENCRNDLSSFFRKVKEREGLEGYHHLLEAADRFIEQQLDPHTGEDMFLDTYLTYHFVKGMLDQYRQVPYQVRMVDGKVILEDQARRWYLVELQPLPGREEIREQLQQEKKTLGDIAAERKVKVSVLEGYLKSR